MFNLHRGGGSGRQAPANRRQKTNEEELRIHAEKLNELFVTFIEIKELENKLNDKCLNSCLNLETNFLETEEKNCLQGCVNKIKPFMKLAKENFMEYERESFNSYEKERDVLGSIKFKV